MGDRANIVFIENSIDYPIFFYTHWRGSEVPEVVRQALIKGKDRWDDKPYLSRIIFQELLGDDKSCTGFGLSTRLCDNEYPFVVIYDNKVYRYTENLYEQHKFNALSLSLCLSFEEYCSQPRDWTNLCHGQRPSQDRI